TVRYRTVLGLRPVAGEDIVGAAAKQQIEAPALRRDDSLSNGRIEIRHRPSAMRVVVAAFVPSAGRLDHAVQRDLFDDPDVSHFESPSVTCFACHISGARECRLTRKSSATALGVRLRYN